jgi:L-cysteine S-thiosulfotransferase
MAERSAAGILSRGRGKNDPATAKRVGVLAACALLAMAAGGARAAQTQAGTASRPALRVVADGVPEPIGGVKGDADRGHALVIAHDAANCILCHALSDPGVRFAGNLGPSLDGIARKLSVAQLRLRVADNLRLNAATIMPSYYRVDGLDRVAGEFRGRPILEADQIEDIVAYLATLK